jgi:hypothetical protein
MDEETRTRFAELFAELEAAKEEMEASAHDADAHRQAWAKVRSVLTELQQVLPPVSGPLPYA